MACVTGGRPCPPRASVLTRSPICRGREPSTPPSLVRPSCFGLTPKYSTWGMSLGTSGPWGTEDLRADSQPMQMGAGRG